MLQDLECHKGAVLSCDVSSDGCLFATTSADRTAKVREEAQIHTSDQCQRTRSCSH